MAQINHLQIHRDNSCYVGYNDTDFQTDYFHGYRLSSLKKMIEWVKRDNQKIKQSDICWVNDSNWTADHKNKVLNRLNNAGILIKEKDEIPQVYFTLNGLRFNGKTFYVTKEGEDCQELNIDEPATLLFIKEALKMFKPVFCGMGDARTKFANVDYEYWRESPYVKDLLPSHI